MTGKRKFNEYMNLTLHLSNVNRLPFGGVSVMTCGDSLQLPPVMDRSVFQLPKKVDYNLLVVNLWIQLFKLHELPEIVRQNTDLEFPEILNRTWEGEHTDDDVEKVNALAETDISIWLQGFVEVFLAIHKLNCDNGKCLYVLHRPIFT